VKHPLGSKRSQQVTIESSCSFGSTSLVHSNYSLRLVACLITLHPEISSNLKYNFLSSYDRIALSVSDRQQGWTVMPDPSASCSIVEPAKHCHKMVSVVAALALFRIAALATVCCSCLAVRVWQLSRHVSPSRNLRRCICRCLTGWRRSARDVFRRMMLPTSRRI
jgi:hypothetical protein